MVDDAPVEVGETVPASGIDILREELEMPTGLLVAKRDSSPSGEQEADVVNANSNNLG